MTCGCGKKGLGRKEGRQERMIRGGVRWEIIFLLNFEELEPAFLDHLSISHLRPLPTSPTSRTQHGSVLSKLWPCPHILLTGKYFCDQCVGNSLSSLSLFPFIACFPCLYSIYYPLTQVTDLLTVCRAHWPQKDESYKGWVPQWQERCQLTISHQ